MIRGPADRVTTLRRPMVRRGPTRLTVPARDRRATPMRIAIVGGGVSGHRRRPPAARRARDRRCTRPATYARRPHEHDPRRRASTDTWHVDTGFIVLNDRNYPRFTRAARATPASPLQPTHMGFSVKGEDEDFEYAGTPRGVFCQRAQPRSARASGGCSPTCVRFNRALRALAAARARRRPRRSREFVARRRLLALRSSSG